MPLNEAKGPSDTFICSPTSYSNLGFGLSTPSVISCFIVCIIIICILLISSAFISASEVAYFSLSASDRQKINNNNVHNLLKNPNRLLATILIVNNFINVGIVVMSSYLTSIAISFPKDSILEFFFQFCENNKA